MNLPVFDGLGTDQPTILQWLDGVRGIRLEDVTLLPLGHEGPHWRPIVQGDEFITVAHGDALGRPTGLFHLPVQMRCTEEGKAVYRTALAVLAPPDSRIKCTYSAIVLLWTRRNGRRYFVVQRKSEPGNAVPPVVLSNGHVDFRHDLEPSAANGTLLTTTVQASEHAVNLHGAPPIVALADTASAVVRVPQDGAQLFGKIGGYRVAFVEPDRLANFMAERPDANLGLGTARAIAEAQEQGRVSEHLCQALGLILLKEAE